MSTIEEILASPNQKEVVVEIDSIKRSDYSAKTWYYTTHFRETGASEAPANTAFPQYLHLEHSTLGPLSQALSEDLFSGLATIDPGTLTLVQSDIGEDQLSQLHDYIFAGRQLRARIGLDSSATYDSSTFPTFANLTVKVDPSINLTSHGIEASFPLASAAERLLAENLITKRYLGIPTGVTYITSSGRASATYNAAYDLLSFTLMGWFKIAASQAFTQGFIRKGSSATNRNFRVAIGSAASGNEGKVEFKASFSGVETAVSSPSTYVDGIWHSWAMGLLDKQTGYLMVDGETVETFTPSVSVDTPNSAIDLGASGQTAIGTWVQIAVFNRYMTPAEARLHSRSRLEGTEPGCIALWRGNDNTDTNINDYGSLGNDAALAGTQNVDWKWDSTDLGEPELAGRPYPINVGEIFNARAQLIDAVRERYRGNVDAVDWHTSTSNTTLAVKSRGTVLTGGGVDYTAPSNGGDGVFSTTAQEDEPVTFDLAKVAPGLAEAYVANVGYNLMIHRSDIGSGDIDTAQLTRLSILCPWRSGWRTEVDSTVAVALQQIYGDSGLTYFEDRTGNIFVDVLRPPVGYGPDGLPALDFAGKTISGFGDVADISGSCTVACWVKPNILFQSGTAVTQSEFQLIGKPGIYFATPNYALYINTHGPSAGSFAFNLGGFAPGNTATSPVGVLRLNEWNFVAAIFDDTANTVKLYAAVLGNPLLEVASATNTGTPATNTDPLYVGGNAAGYPWGSIRNAQVWSTASTLTSLQGQAELTTTLAGNESGLVFYAPLSEGTGSPTDLVSSNAATLADPVRWAPRLVVDLDVTPSVTLSDFHRLDPAGEIIIQYGRNWNPMSASDIDTGVSQNAALDLKRDWKEVGTPDPEILTNYAHSKKILLKSALTTQEGAEKLYGLLADRFSEDRWIGKLAFPPGLEISARACGLKLMDEIGVIASIPSQLLQGRSFRVIAVAPNLLDLSTTVIFWG